ncbi:IS5 family transposase, partial [Chromobacterium phragmitis]|uniref:IS5 family transposase n=1 Tax=Chromobacterium phragmitis TaxID=2202141 RepID=UPI003D367968
DDFAALNGILFVLTTGIPWEDLPQELGFGSGMTCWRRLRDWQAQGIWDRLHLALLIQLRQHDQIDWSRASIDGASVAKPPGGQETGPNPTDRGKCGSKRHIIVDRRGLPLALSITGANRHDSMVFETLVDAIPAVPGLPGRPRQKPYKLHADKGYDYRRCRAHLSRSRCNRKSPTHCLSARKCRRERAWAPGKTDRRHCRRTAPPRCLLPANPSFARKRPVPLPINCAAIRARRRHCRSTRVHRQPCAGPRPVRRLARCIRGRICRLESPEPERSCSTAAGWR